MRSGFRPPLTTHPRSRPVRQAATECARAEALLGAGHPLVTVLRASLTAAEQLLAVAASLAVAATLLYEKSSFGLPVVVGSGVVQLALGCRLAVMASRRRDICRELIVAGRECLALAGVELERSRLSDARVRDRLARSFEDVADVGLGRRFEPQVGPPLLHSRVVRSVVPELHELARLLRADAAPVRGVALVEWLLTSGESPLYGPQRQHLREELGRARYFLSEG
jgi:hypothetical protein